MMSNKPALSISENLYFAYCIFRAREFGTKYISSTISQAEKATNAVASAGYGLVSFPFLTKRDRASVLFKHVAYSGLRSLTENSTIRMIRMAALMTDESYAQFAVDQKFPPNSVTLKDGTKLHWMGEENSKKTMLFFHGGGYINYANSGQLKFLLNNIVKTDPSKMSILFLSYDVAPEHGYPRQLQQAVNALDYLIHTKKKDIKDVILSGDSAGGNLAVGLLSHLSHTHPTIPELKINGKLGGAALLSPWVSFDVETATSMHTNASKDCLSAAVLRMFAKNFLGSADRDCWNEPSSAPAEWWRDLKVEQILLVAGADELFVDDVRSFAATLKNSHLATTLFVAEREAHDQPVLDIIFGYPEPGEQSKYFMSWVKAVSEDRL